MAFSPKEKPRFMYKVCNIKSPYFNSPFAMILHNGIAVGKPLEEREARIVLEWLLSLTDYET